MTQIEKELEIKKLAKRMGMLVRELELSSLDIASYASPLSKGLFPTSWAKEANKAFEDYSTEMQRILNNFKEIFKDALDAEEQVVVSIKKKKRK